MYKVRHRRRADGEAGQEELQREDVVAVEGDELPSVVSACLRVVRVPKRQTPALNYFNYL